MLPIPVPTVVHFATTFAENPEKPVVGKELWVRKLEPVKYKEGTPFCRSITPALMKRG
jgi:hypothetical protein